MTIARAPALAGQFYPASAHELRKSLSNLLDAAAQKSPTLKIPSPKAVIVPHAAYEYSGPIAACAYAALAQERKIIRRIILIGPSHFIPVDGLALSSKDAFATPVGYVRIDKAAVSTIKKLAHAYLSDEAHGKEHSLEVQIPFLQETLDNFSLVPIAVGNAKSELVGKALEALWGGPETRIVISSDLSHYQDYKTARKRDLETARIIESLDTKGVSETRACGYRAINGMLRVARKQRMRATTIDLRSSGDTAGERSSVVGYGAFAFFESGDVSAI